MTFKFLTLLICFNELFFSLVIFPEVYVNYCLVCQNMGKSFAKGVELGITRCKKSSPYHSTDQNAHRAVS